VITRNHLKAETEFLNKLFLIRNTGDRSISGCIYQLQFKFLPKLAVYPFLAIENTITIESTINLICPEIKTIFGLKFDS
jgi:hypothetical protein